MLAEFLSYIEEAIRIKYEYVIFQKKLPVIALEKFINSANNIMSSMEQENPNIKNESDASNEIKKRQLEVLYQNAHNALENGNYTEAKECYERILTEKNDDWEATFYSMFCEYADNRFHVNAAEIESNCSRMGVCACKAIKLSKNQLFTRNEILNGMANITTKLSAMTSTYFVTTIDDYNQDRGLRTKLNRINAIIKMMFDVGDTIEEKYGDDSAICSATACECWKIALACYENCRMITPPSAEDHYKKIKKYDPSYQCSKDFGKSKKSGCYIATAIYGSYDCPPVWTLRRYRDYILTNSWYGRIFIRVYYSISPTLIKWFGNTHWFRRIWKKILDYIVDGLKKRGVENTPYKDWK